MDSLPVKAWSLGDPCFIVDMTLHPGLSRMRVMPAIVTHIGGVEGRAVTATAMSPPRRVGPILVEGVPFRTETEARAWVAQCVGQIRRAAEQVPLEGSRPEWSPPAGFPKNGDIVYCIDGDAKEVLEVVVGIVTNQCGEWQIGYDPVPGGNPEISCVLVKEWGDKETAFRVARERYGEEFAFVSKEEVARRANEENRTMWDGIRRNTHRTAGMLGKLKAALEQG